jgi:protein SCO1/2
MKLAKLVCLVLACVVIAPGCQPKFKRYNLRGQVMSKNVAANEIMVKHDDIPGFMAAMTMPYRVKQPGVVQELEAGDLIAAEVVTTNDESDYWLEDVRITNGSGRKTAQTPAPPGALQPGERVPGLPLVNQDGKTIRLDDFKGKAVLLTFVYTRCPLPTFCPRLSSQFAKIHEDLAKTPDVYGKTHLLTISFDSKYDTPPVLRRYGLAYLDNDASGFSHWEFASASPGDLPKLADAFGLVYFEQDNQIAHSINIVLISPEGTIAKYWSNNWTTVELEDALRQQAAQSASATQAFGAGRSR